MSSPSPFYRGVDSDDDMSAFANYVDNTGEGEGSTDAAEAQGNPSESRQPTEPPSSSLTETISGNIGPVEGSGAPTTTADQLQPVPDDSPPHPSPAQSLPSTMTHPRVDSAWRPTAPLLKSVPSGRSLSSHSGGGSGHNSARSLLGGLVTGGGGGGGGGGNKNAAAAAAAALTASRASSAQQGGSGANAASSGRSLLGSSIKRLSTFGSSTATRKTSGGTTSRALRSSQLNKSRIVRMQSHNVSGGDESSNELDAEPRVFRRYEVGDYVLVCILQTRWVILVNRHGFPPGEGDSPEERRGPYKYVLATVKKVHYEEIQAYYTVTRMDTGADQRADVAYMEPLRTTRGEMAAMKAATETSPAQAGGSENALHDSAQLEFSQNKCLACLELSCLTVLMPFLWLCVCCGHLGRTYVAPCWAAMSMCVKHHARKVLNGLEPYNCRIRITCVNFVVVCSTWYMFIDQVRLAFFPASADLAIAATNFAVWVVLVLELMFEVFIRPDGYLKLIQSDKAFAPATVRYISAFHLVVESIALLVFIPEWLCIFGNDEIECDERLPFSFYNAALQTVIGPTLLDAFYGHAFLALIRLRVVGLLRHWKNMWISNTFINMSWRGKNGMISSILPFFSSAQSHERKSLSTKKKPVDPEVAEQKKRDLALTNASTIGTALMVTNSYRAVALLWVIVGIFPIIIGVNSVLLNPVSLSMTLQMQGTNLVANDTSNETCGYLRDSTWAWIATMTPTEYPASNQPFLLTMQLLPQRCDFQQLYGSVEYLCNRTVEVVSPHLGNFKYLDDLDTEDQDFVEDRAESLQELCKFWFHLSGLAPSTLARSGGLRAGSVLQYDFYQNASLTNASTGDANSEIFAIYTIFDASATVALASKASLLLQLCLLIGVLGGLSVLRRDAEVLVLGPLRRMLKRVAQYARNPLMPPKPHRYSSSQKTKASGRSAGSNDEDDDDAYSDASYDDEDNEPRADDLGSYETEQLNTAINKITDLLRKCWGVAGAGIISTNLATREGALTEVFNPTVPGNSVYALFAFAAINDFDHALRELQGDVMILINDVASVLHREVFRWGFGDSGQCNKNLGSAFLMVFRIGLVKEVMEKLEEATDVVFSTGTAKSSHGSHHAGTKRRNRSITSHSSRQSTKSSVSSYSSNSHHTVSRTAAYRKAASGGRRNKMERSSTAKAMSLSLQSLPGISTFTDRAVIGMLKSFAGMYRDNKIRSWNNDFRLGQGVGVFTVSMIFGMDAGWAVEGAVGSEYKIDATYLSPHVNMASRMASACKQYNVTIMLSQAVQELMSDTGGKQMRHLDTVTVKGSSVKQKIFTYDARPKGVDFFLYSRSDDQADMDAERYSPQTWINDQDLRAMRQHVSEEFLDEFNAGRKAYMAGDWPVAIRKLERANEIMIETALEQGYLEDEFEALQAQMGYDAKGAEEELKRENGDGPSLFLVSFMKNQGGVAPKGWDGWHPLTRK